MQPDLPSQPVSKGMLWTGRILTGLIGLFMLMDGVMKLAKPEFVVKPSVELGFSEAVIVPLGVVLTISAILYLIPATTVLGAILLTGYLGGAVCLHVLKGHGWFEIFFPVIFGVAAWFGIYFRVPRLRALIPLRS